MYSQIVHDQKVYYLACMLCGKTVSTGWLPAMTGTPDKGLILRAIVTCPECFQREVSRKDLEP